MRLDVGNLKPGPELFSPTRVSSLFDRTQNQFMLIGQPTSLAFNPLNDEFTISAWFKASSSTSSGVLISRSSSSNRFIQISISGSGTAEGYSAGAYRNSNVDVVSDRAWHLITLVNYKDSGGTFYFKVYVDGVLPVAELAAGSNITTNADWLIGARRNTTTSDTAFQLNGFADEIAIWNVPLSQPAVAAIYQAGRAQNLFVNVGSYSSAASVVSWWRLGDWKSDDCTLSMTDAKFISPATPINMSESCRSEDP